MSQKLYVKDSGVWKQVGIVYQKIAGVWTTLYIGKIKNTFGSIKREVSSFTNEIDIDDITHEKDLKKENKKKDE